MAASEKEKRLSSSNDSARTSDEKSHAVAGAVKIDVVADKTSPAAAAESEGLPPVPFFDMFRFSTRLEIFLDGRSLTEVEGGMTAANSFCSHWYHRCRIGRCRPGTYI